MRRYRRRKSFAHLHLEPLEDRTALSGWSPSVTPVVPSQVTAAATAVNSTPNDDASYPDSSSNGITTAAVAGPNVQPGSSNSQSTAPAASGNYSAQNQLSYSQSFMQSQAAMYDASSMASYATEYAKYVAQQAEAALRAAEMDVVRVLLPAGSGSQSAQASETRSNETVAENAVAGPDSPPVPAPVPIGNARNDGEAILPLHSHPAREEWTAQLVAGLEEAGGSDQAMHSSEMRLAAAGLETREQDVESGNSLAGALQVNVEALEQKLNQFFAYLGSQAPERLDWSGVMNVGAWMAAGMAATAAYELARRSARVRPVPQFGDLAWQEPRLGLLTGDDAL